MDSTIFKPHFRAAAKLLAAAALMLLAMASARAQGARQGPDGRLRLDSLEAVGARASETVSVDVDGILLRLGKSVLSDDDPEEKTVKEIIEGLRGVYVRSYEFKSDGEFKESDLAPIREQLRGPGWTRLVDLKSRGVELDGAEVYALTVGGRVEGMAVLVVESKHLTVVNVSGSLDLEKLKRLEGSLGIPRIHVGRGEKEGRKR